MGSFSFFINTLGNNTKVRWRHKDRCNSTCAWDLVRALESASPASCKTPAISTLLNQPPNNKTVIKPKMNDKNNLCTSYRCLLGKQCIAQYLERLLCKVLQLSQLCQYQQCLAKTIR